MTGLHHNQRFVGQGLHGDRPAAGQPVVGRNRDEQRLAEQSRRPEPDAKPHLVQERQIHLSFKQGLSQRRRRLFPEADGQVGVLPPKFLQERREKIGAGRRQAAQGHLAPLQTIELGKIAARFLELAQRLGGPGLEKNASRGQSDSGAVAFEEQSSRLVLQLGDLAGKRRLRNVTDLRRCRKGSGADHGKKIPKLVNFHS